MDSTPVITAAKVGQDHHAPLVPKGRLLPFVLVTALFFLWGIPNNLNDILIRQFMKSFEMTRLQAGLVQSAFYMGYFLLAMPAGQIMRRAGYKAGILIGLCLYGAGCILFWPAAIIAQYWFFLMALFVIASGLAFLETAASPFIIQLGPAESAAQRVNFSQAFNPLGSISAVLVGSRFIFSGIELKPEQVAALQAQHQYQDYLRSETLRVIAPYLVLGTVVLIWAILIARTPFPHTGMDYSRNTIATDHSKPLWARKHFVFAVIAQFLYVGAQVGIWSYLIPYVQSYTGSRERTAGYWLTGALVAFTIGRFVSTWLLRFVSAHRLLCGFALVNAVTCARCGIPAGLARRGMPCHSRILHVHDVSNHLCAWREGAGHANENRRSADRDVNHRRSRSHAGDGAFGRCRRNRTRLHSAGRLFHWDCALRLAWISARS